MHRLLARAPPPPPLLRGAASLAEPRARAPQVLASWPAGRRPAGARSIASDSFGVQISEDRLKEFLQAEVSFFAGQEPRSISMRQILDASTPELSAALTHTELPIRFAQRIIQISSLPGWETSPELVQVHKLYSTTFRDLRLVELDFNNLEPFTMVIQTIKERMKGVIPSLAMAMRRLQKQEGFTEEMITDWLDTFLLSRIGTEMLTSQYIACTTANIKAKKNRRGIVDEVCDPVSLCEQAAKQTKKLARHHCNIDKDVLIQVEQMDAESRVKFPYVPQYLFYIMVELLKNSARATVETTMAEKGRLEDRKIIISVGADETQVAIRVHDKAGGIPFNVADRVWSYMYSTVKSDNASQDFSTQGTPLAGYGVGLPLSRLYARYLGGSLHLMSMPGIGTSAYLYLKRFEDDAREEVPSSVGSLYDPTSNLLV